MKRPELPLRDQVTLLELALHEAECARDAAKAEARGAAQAGDSIREAAQDLLLDLANTYGDSACRETADALERLASEEG